MWRGVREIGSPPSLLITFPSHLQKREALKSTYVRFTRAEKEFAIIIFKKMNAPTTGELGPTIWNKNRKTDFS